MYIKCPFCKIVILLYMQYCTLAFHLKLSFFSHIMLFKVNNHFLKIKINLKIKIYEVGKTNTLQNAME